jgi:hypothetical protein
LVLSASPNTLNVYGQYTLAISGEGQAGVREAVIPRRGFSRQRRGKDCASAMFGLFDEARGESNKVLRTRLVEENQGMLDCVLDDAFH